jgi:hypothetical protein
VFNHKDRKGFNIMLQAFPLDGKIVCREITAEAEAEDAAPNVNRIRNNNPNRSAPSGRR